VSGLGRARLGGLNLGYSANGVGHGAVGKGVYECVGPAASPTPDVVRYSGLYRCFSRAVLGLLFTLITYANGSFSGYILGKTYAYHLR
jgi:hypothetical protein